jgi:hypothetical protein
LKQQVNGGLLLPPTPREAQLKARTGGLQRLRTLQGRICYIDFDGVQFARHCLRIDVHNFSNGGESVRKGGLDRSIATMLGMEK